VAVVAPVVGEALAALVVVGDSAVDTVAGSVAVAGSPRTKDTRSEHLDRSSAAVLTGGYGRRLRCSSRVKFKMPDFGQGRVADRYGKAWPDRCRKKHQIGLSSTKAVSIETKRR